MAGERLNSASRPCRQCTGDPAPAWHQRRSMIALPSHESRRGRGREAALAPPRIRASSTMAADARHPGRAGSADRDSADRAAAPNAGRSLPGSARPRPRPTRSGPRRRPPARHAPWAVRAGRWCAAGRGRSKRHHCPPAHPRRRSGRRPRRTPADQGGRAGPRPDAPASTAAAVDRTAATPSAWAVTATANGPDPGRGRAAARR